MHDTELVLTLVMMVAACATFLMLMILIRNSIACQGRSSLHKISASTVESYMVERSCNTEIRNNCRIIMFRAVSVRRHVHYEAYMERRLAVHYRIRIFRYLAVKNFRSVIILHYCS